MRASLLTLLGLAVGCRCPGPVKPVELSPLEVAPAQLTFPPTYLGSSSRQVVELRNPNVVERPLEPVLEGPFTIDPVTAIAPGETLGLSVTFRPLQPGVAQGRLSIEAREVLLSGEGRAVPVCTADACHDPRFDEAAGQCVMDLAPDGRNCSTRCLPTGSCVRGECLGTTPACDDENACTVDACSDQLGCVHARRSCQRPVDRCKRAECDPVSGCTIVDAPEGTLCGPDDCAASTVDVCLQGRCLTRTRPMNARCANTWLPLTVPAHGQGNAIIGYDETSGLVLLVSVGNAATQTWRWDGTAWELLLPLRPLPSLLSPAMVLDPATGRLVVVGRGETKVEHWEWDGTGWFDRPIQDIDCIDSFSLGVEPLTRRLLLACRDRVSGNVSQLWSFDGLGWRREPDAPWTSEPRFISAPATNGLLAVVSVPVRTHQTYEWRSSGFVKRDDATLGFGCGGVDPLNQEAVWFGVAEDGGMHRWRWRTSRWLDEGQALTEEPHLCLTTLDSRRNQLVLTGGSIHSRSSTWEWDGRQLLERSKATPELIAPVLISAQSPLLFGTPNLRDEVSYRFTGRGWEPAGVMVPPGQRVAAAAWDPLRAELVASLADPNQSTRSTWVFDGGSWSVAEAMSSRPDPGARVVYSPALERIIAVGSNQAPADAIAMWTGAQWQPFVATGGPSNVFLPATAVDVTGAPVVVATGTNDTALETFRWTDGGWATLPRPPVTASMTTFGIIALGSIYDPTRQRTVLLALPVDPQEGGMLTFEWSGATWTARSPTLSPPRETSVLLAFDPNSRRVLFYEQKQTWAFFP